MVVFIVSEGKADPSEMGTLRDLMNHLSGCVVSKKTKNTEVLHIAAEVGDRPTFLCRRLGDIYSFASWQNRHFGGVFRP